MVQWVGVAGIRLFVKTFGITDEWVQDGLIGGRLFGGWVISVGKVERLMLVEYVR